MPPATNKPREVSRDPDSQTSITDGETMDVVAVKEMLLLFFFYKADTPLYRRNYVENPLLEQRIDGTVGGL